MRRAAALAPALALVLGLAGCGGDAGPVHPLVIGTGVSAFEPIEPGEAVPLQMGLQGGYHVWLSFRAEGLLAERTLVTLAIRTDDPGLGADIEVYVPLEDDPDADPPGAMFVGFPAQLPDAACFVGKTIDLDLTLEGESGRTAHGTQQLVVGPLESGIDPGPCAR
jgi:hypothetical protein